MFKISPDKQFFLILLISIVVFYSNLGGSSIYILDEARNATCAREMYDRGDPVVPTFNGELRTDKPPLHYFFMMLGFKLFGVSPFSARFFSALMGVLTTMLVFLFIRNRLDAKSGLFSALILISSLLFSTQFHLAVPDPYLIFLTTLSALTLFEFIETDRWQPLFLSYTAMGLAFMTKGPIGILIPALGYTFYMALSNQFGWRMITRIKPLYGILIVVAISFPWYALVYQATGGEWVREFFLTHNLSRYTDTMEGHRGFPLLPFVIMLVALLPFSVFIIQAVRRTWLLRFKSPLLLFSLSMVMGLGVFFSFSQTVLPSYTSPALPFLAITLGGFIAQLAPERRNLISLIVLLLITMTMPVVAYYAIAQDKSITDLKDLAWWLSIIPLSVIVGIFCYSRNRMPQMVFSLSAGFILAGLIFMYLIMPRMDRNNPVNNSLDLIRNTESELYFYQRMNSSYMFYLETPIPRIEDETELNKLLRENRSLLIISRRDKARELMQREDLKVVFEQKDLFEKHTTVILAN